MKPQAGRGGKTALASCRAARLMAPRIAKRATRFVAPNLTSTLLAPLLTTLLALPLAAHAADLKAVNAAAGLGASGASAVTAASGAAGLGAGSAVPALGFGAVMQTVFGLALVIGVVFGCAWLARRLGLQGTPRNALVKTVGGASLGGTVRVAVVEIGDTWLVLGTAPGNVRLLHTMPAGSAPEPTGPGPASPLSGNFSSSFGQRFRDAMKDEASKRFRRHDGGAQ